MQRHQLDAAILAIVVAKEQSRCVYIMMAVYPWRAEITNATTPARCCNTGNCNCQRTFYGSVPIHVQRHQLDAAILAIVIVKERSRCVYIMMVVYPWRAASTNATTPA